MTIANIDFETYSEAGFVWDATRNKWAALPGASQGKKGLPVVGASVYVEHPTFEVLTLSYDLRRGAGVQRWRPGLPPPVDLLAHVAAGGLVSGWNAAGFEMKVWRHCVERYFWPPLPLSQVRDSMAAARAFCYPGALGKAGEVMGLKQQKNADGKRLLDKFSIPRNPTKPNAALRIRPEDDPVDAEKLYAYCDEDVLTEQEAASLIPPLSPKELAAWQTDRAINDRGVQIDLEGVHNCIAIINQAHARYNAELRALTGGTVDRASELAKLQGWLGAKGVVMASMDEEALDTALKQDLPPPARRALEIRQAVGSASVKKVFTMANMVSRDGRLRDLFIYHGARTGRPTGSGPQPTNLPNSAGAFAMECEGCDKHYGVALDACPWCGASSVLAHKIEWSAECAEDALESFKPRSLDWTEYVWGDAMAAVSNSLRALFVAAPGHDLICSDYSSIEAVGLAMLAGEQWRIDLFRTHGKIYEMSASKITGIPFDEMMQHAGYTAEQLSREGWWLDGPANEGSHHPSRKTIGKVAELACFSPDTQVLTDRGYVGIVDVQLTDKLWDGVEWVSHAGSIKKGVRSVISLDGVRMTPTHPVSTGRSWKAASELASNESILSRALETGSANLPWSKSILGTPGASGTYGHSALAVATPTESSIKTSFTDGQPDAPDALKNKAQRLGFVRLTKSLSSLRRVSFPTRDTAVAFLTAWLPPLEGATGNVTPLTSTMVAEESLCSLNGEKTRESSFGTSSPWRAGITRFLRWIGVMSMETTSRETSGSSRNGKTTRTAELSKNYNAESLNWSVVYDIVNAGPRHRFTIRTNSGHLLVHNSGYQGWTGSWCAFGADAFMSEDEMKAAILAWRAASPNIVELWGGQERNWKPEYYGVEGMFVQAILNPGIVYRTHGMDFQMRGDVLFLRLLSGRELTYHRPRLAPSTRRPGTYSISYEGWNSNPKNGPMGWYRMETWGGRLVENCVAGDALVLTRRGWVKLRFLRASDWVHDGVDFVRHGGLLFKSVQPCVPIDGVWMTKDHEVLTDEGWRTAETKPRPLRSKVWDAPGFGAGSSAKPQKMLGFLMRLRNPVREGRNRGHEGGKEGAYPELRVRGKSNRVHEEKNARDEQTPGLRSLEVNERSLSATLTPGLGKLRGSRHLGLRKVANFLRELLGRHGRLLPKRVRPGPEGQRGRVRPGELSLGGSTRKHDESPGNRSSGGRTSSVQENRDFPVNSLLPAGERVGAGGLGAGTERHEQVFDILDCGPRHRFLVLGDGGPFLVHNCNQAQCRDIQWHGVQALERAGYPIVLHVYDEDVAEVPEGFGSVEEFERIMGDLPEWCADWPIKAQGGWRRKRYGK